MTSEEVLELRIPPGAEFIGTARLFVAAAGRQFALSEDVLADVRVAVSEVCAEAMEAQLRPDHVRIVVRARADSLEVEVLPHVPAGVGGGTAEAQEQAMGTDAQGPDAAMAKALRGPLIHALFPDASFETDPAHLVVSVPWDA